MFSFLSLQNILKLNNFIDSNDSGTTEMLESSDMVSLTIMTIMGISSIYYLLKSLFQVPISDPKKLPKEQKIFGFITHANDSDNVRFVHRTTLSYLNPWKDGNSMNIRLAGIDAPEMAHFGQKAQPFSKEAKSYLHSIVANRDAFIIPHSVDQYGRSVSSVYVKCYQRNDYLPIKALKIVWSLFWTFSRYFNVSLEMTKRGYACVYIGGGAVYGGIYDELVKAEKRARWWRKGMWSLGSRYISPRDHKRNRSNNNNKCQFY